MFSLPQAVNLSQASFKVAISRESRRAGVRQSTVHGGSRLIPVTLPRTAAKSAPRPAVAAVLHCPGRRRPVTGNRAHALASSMPVRAVQARGPPLVLALLLGLVPAQAQGGGYGMGSEATAVHCVPTVHSPPSLTCAAAPGSLRAAGSCAATAPASGCTASTG